MSDTQLRDEIITLLLASHETTANALAWTWYLLASHPGHEARLHAEIDAAIAGGCLARAEDIPKLPFTRMVLAESMRLYPPAWLLARVAVENHEARGYTISPGFLVVISPWVVHRSAAGLSGSGHLRPRPVERGGSERSSSLLVFPVRRRIARMYGGGICVDGRGSCPRCHRAAVALSPARRDGASRIHPALTLTPKSGIRVRLERRASVDGVAPQRSRA